MSQSSGLALWGLHPSSVAVMRSDRPQLAKWRRLSYVQFVATALLSICAGLAFAGEVGVPADGGLAPVLMAIVLLVLALRSSRKARGVS